VGLAVGAGVVGCSVGLAVALEALEALDTRRRSSLGNFSHSARNLHLLEMEGLLVLVLHV
jgi:hypothetical protein